jgi:uncharacterized membrane protein YkgB
MVAGSALVLVMDHSTPVAVIAAIGLVEGVPTALNSLGLQTALYVNAPPTEIGTAGGLLQTSRYLGAISVTTLLGLIFGARASDAGLHLVGLIMLGISLILVPLSAAFSDPRRATE